MGTEADLPSLFPGMFVLGKRSTTPEGKSDLEAYLKKMGWVEASDRVLWCDAAGEVFNMNCTMRVALESGEQLVVKQSRPWVERYPTVPAPPERTFAEAKFYQLLQSRGRPEVTRLVPKLRGVDPSSYLLAMQDLGAKADYSSLYSGKGSIPDDEVHALAAWLSDLHRLEFTEDEKAELRNDAMRKLNHAYIFDLPLTEGSPPDLDAITPGLATEAAKIRGDTKLVETVRGLGQTHYLSDTGSCLLHGDFFPASWLQGPHVIDVEFAHFGHPEFDVGVAVAHFHLAGLPEKESAFLEKYTAPLDTRLMRQLAGTEIVRRLLGLAQLPLAPPLSELPHKQRLLEQAREWIVH